MKKEEVRKIPPRRDGEQAPRDLGERTIAYSLRVIGLFRELQVDPAGHIIAKQLLRAATSIGANVHEAHAAQSKRDFIAKMSVAHKEARETAYWLRLIAEGGFVAPSRSMASATRPSS